jgi:isoquinoline 1-oxidoreductase beta subunit
MADIPEVIDVAFVERDAPPSGLGEIGNPWVAAAVGNAVYKLTGKRLTHMPFTQERVKQTLSA